MNKSFWIATGVVAVAVVGYIIYMSYFTAENTIGKDVGVIGGEENTQPPVMPTTEEQKLDVLDELTSSANAPTGAASDSAKEEVLNSAAGPPKNSATPAKDSEKIKLLESLKE